MDELSNAVSAQNENEYRQYRLAPASLEKAEMIQKHFHYFLLAFPAALVIPPLLRMLLSEAAWDSRRLATYLSAGLMIYLAIVAAGYLGCRSVRKSIRQRWENYRIAIEPGFLVVQTEIPVRKLFKYVNVPHCSRIDLSKVSEVKVGHLSGSQDLFMRIRYGWGLDLPRLPLVAMENFISELASQVPVKVKYTESLRLISGLRMGILLFVIAMLLTGLVYNYFIWTRHL